MVGFTKGVSLVITVILSSACVGGLGQTDWKNAAPFYVLLAIEQLEVEFRQIVYPHEHKPLKTSEKDTFLAVFKTFMIKYFSFCKVARENKSLGHKHLWDRLNRYHKDPLFETTSKVAR